MSFQNYLNLSGQSSVCYYSIGELYVSILFSGNNQVYTYTVNSCSKDILDSLKSACLNGKGANTLTSTMRGRHITIHEPLLHEEVGETYLKWSKIDDLDNLPNKFGIILVIKGRAVAALKTNIDNLPQYVTDSDECYFAPCIESVADGVLKYISLHFGLSNVFKYDWVKSYVCNLPNSNLIPHIPLPKAKSEINRMKKGICHYW